MKKEKSTIYFLTVITALLLTIFLSGNLSLQKVQADQENPATGKYEITFAEGIGRYQISSWAAQTGNAGYHHYGYFVLDTVTGEVVGQKMKISSNEN